MKELPSGNYALAIAHPGHELRLHGFLEQVKPFVFILTDNSEATGQDMMWHSIKAISRAVGQGMNITPAQAQEPFMRKVLKLSLKEEEGKEKAHIKDSQIQYEVMNRHTGFLNYYVDFMVENLIRYKINYLVCDASEEYHLTHEIVRMLCDIAILKVKNKTGDEIELFDFAISEFYNSRINEHCIHIKLNEEQTQRKLHACCIMPFGIEELKPNINIDVTEINYLRKKKEQLSFGRQVLNVLSNIAIVFHLKDRKKITDEEQFVFLKQALMEYNPDFFRNEYLRPARMFKETDNYKNIIVPIYGKMIQEAISA